MRAINHALTGAAIGLIVGQPVVAVPAAFASHFVCDAIPHFGLKPSGDIATTWFKILLVVDALLCGVLVGMLALFHPAHWITAAVSAFAATSPDFMHIPRFVESVRTGKERPNRTWYEKFHGQEVIQWFQRPIGAIVEVAWVVAGIVFLAAWL